MGIRRRRVDEDRVERQRPAVEQVRHLGQEDGHVVGPTLVDRGPRVRTHEQRPVPEMGRHLRGEMRPRALRVEMDHPDVLQLGRPGHERVEQDRRGRRRALDVDLLAARMPETASAGETMRMAETIVRWVGPALDGPTNGVEPGAGRLDVDQAVGSMGQGDVGPIELGPNLGRTGHDDTSLIDHFVDRPGLESRLAFSRLAAEHPTVVRRRRRLARR